MSTEELREYFVQSLIEISRANGTEEQVVDELRKRENLKKYVDEGLESSVGNNSGPVFHCCSARQEVGRHDAVSQNIKDSAVS